MYGYVLSLFEWKGVYMVLERLAWLEKLAEELPPDIASSRIDIRLPIANVIAVVFLSGLQLHTCEIIHIKYVALVKKPCVPDGIMQVAISRHPVNLVGHDIILKDKWCLENDSQLIAELFGVVVACDDAFQPVGKPLLLIVR